ncbi:MAG: hypothetical protein H7X85_11985, partial [Thermoanaerobaculia bacterium]|nr:hypothetical protein [Thermoanaerobaculia bacterium]
AVRALQPTQRWEPAILYAAFAAVFCALGFGSYWGRRWARDLILVGSVFSLATALLAMPVIIWIVAQISTADPRLSGVRDTVGCAVTAVLAAMMVVFISLPLSFLLFYSRRDVRLTVERLDPARRWTQAQPLPVLGAALVYAVSAAGSLAALVHPVLPVPGGVLTGAAARGVLLAVSVASGAVAWGLYRGKRGAWMAAAGLTVAWLAFSLLSFRDLDLRELRRVAGASEEELQQMPSVDITLGLTVMVAVSGVVWLGYLWWLRKYFGAPRTPQ